MPHEPETAVIITTYNWPWALERALTALRRQTDPHFSVVVADDGSRDETRDMLDRMREQLPFPLLHAWQEDRGFRRGEALNNAVRHTGAECLIFTDQDSLPAANWIADHRRRYAPGRFVVGGYVRLTEEQSRGLSIADVQEGAHERLMTDARRRHLWRYHLANLWSLTVRLEHRPRIMGLNFSVARDLFDKVNGFDHEYVGWGKEDSDLRCRMRQAGGSARSIWHRSFVFHLWHESHPSKGAKEKNQARYNAIKQRKLPWRCVRGLADLGPGPESIRKEQEVPGTS